SVINNGLLIGLANHTILVARDGTERSIADSGAPIFNNKNELIGVVFVFRDVSEERKFQKKIFESEQRFSYIINNATEGVYFLDSEGKIVIWNKGMETISGFSSEEALGNFAWDIMYECVNPDKKNVAYYNSLKESFLIALKSGEVNWLNRKNTGVMYLRNGSVKHFDQYSFLVPMQNSTGLASIINDNSEIFKSNETLRKSEEKFHKTFSMSPDTIIISRLSDGLVINANSGFLNVFGYKKNEIIGKSIFTFNFWINTEDSENLIKQLVDKKEVYHLELKLYSKSRNIIYSSVSAKLIEIENEKYIIIYSQDITQIKQLEDELRNTFLEQEKIIDSRNFELEQINEELKSKIEDREKAEKALINSEEKFRSFFNQLPVGAYRTTKDGNFLQVNKALVVILGFDTEDELLNTKAQFFYLSENERNEIIKKQADSPNIVSIENPFKRKDGKIIWVRDSAKIFRKADGSIDYMEGIIEDITFRKLAQEALSESEERYRLLFENLHDIFFCINTKGYIQNISPSVEKIIGFTAEEMIGKNIADVFENKEAKEEIIDLFNKSKQINNFVTSVKHKDGSILQISINAYFTFDKEGKFNSIDGIARDITSEINHEKFINVLYSISKSVNTAITMNELYFLLHIAMNEIIDTKNFFIADFNRITQKISFPYLTDEYIDYLEDIDLDDDSYFVTQVIKEAKPFLLKGQQITDLNAKMFSNQRICPKVWYCIPLVVHSEVIGAVGIYNYEDSDKFKKDQLELFLSIAEQIAIAIERKKSSVAVRFQNLFLQNLIDNIPNPVYYKDSVRRQFEGCNHAFEQFTGLPKEEILGKTVFDIFPLDNAAKYDRNETELIKIQGVSKYEDSLRRSDGLEQYFVFYHSCFRNNNNEVAGIVGTILNITDIKHAEEELKQNHEYSELINKVVPSCTFTVNTKRTITSWNERAAQLTGYFAEEVIGKDCILCRFHKPEQACPLFNTSVKKPVLGMEIEITTKTGEKKHIIKNMDILQNSG
ncbi:MAG: PAS domain S-box protein, partial [Bacteroidota bacterium]